jgi:hypothetical protein
VGRFRQNQFFFGGIVMNKQQVLDIVKVHQDQLNDFAVKELFLFGSVARGEETENSDVDFLVNFQRPVGLFTLLKLKSYLEELLGCSVDIGTPDSLRPHLKETVFKEVIRAI